MQIVVAFGKLHTARRRFSIDAACSGAVSVGYCDRRARWRDFSRDRGTFHVGVLNIPGRDGALRFACCLLALPGGENGQWLGVSPVAGVPGFHWRVRGIAISGPLQVFMQMPAAKRVERADDRHGESGEFSRHLARRPSVLVDERVRWNTGMVVHP